MKIPAMRAFIAVILVIIIITGFAGCLAGQESLPASDNGVIRPEMNIRRITFISVSAAISFSALTTLGILFTINKRKNKLIETQTTIISAIYESLPDLIFSRDRDGKFTSCNRAFEEFMGFEISEVIGKTSGDIYLDKEELIIESRKSDQKVLAENITVRVEDWLVDPNGAKRLFEIVKSPLFFNGKVIGLLGIMRDVTEHRTALDRARIMLDKTPLICNLWTEDMKIFDCNDVALKLFGVSDKSEYMDRFLEFTPEFQPNGMRTSDHAVKCHNEAFEKGICVFESTLQKPDGTPIPMEVTLVRVAYGGENILVAYGRDLREHNKMTEDLKNAYLQLEDALYKARMANKAKSDFLARVSHEIRTPMNAIIGMTELALREYMSDKAYEHVFTVKQAGANVLTIINDILDFSKIETGKLNIISDKYSFTSLMNDVISIIRMRVFDSQIRFAVNIDSNIPDALIGDETRIRQILINILGNAVKYTDKGFVYFSVQGEITEDNTVNLTMEVTDTGRGIKKEDLNNLFSEYMQLELERNKGIEGTGLGLAISWNLIKAMNGKITVASEYSRGSTFTVTLPQIISKPGKIAAVKNPGEKSVLLYESRNIYVNSITKTLNNLGVRNTCVATTDELCENLKTGMFSYLFVSYELYEENRKIISGSASNTGIVLLAEFGERIPEGNWSVLSMPIHAVSIANVLNGAYGEHTHITDDAYAVRLYAPDARVLVVDDLSTNLKVAEGLLRPYGMKIDLCKSGVEAIDAVKASRYDLVFMDHRMPGMDGIEATRHIREMSVNNPYYAQLPIIALTANAVSGMMEMFLENGLNDYLSKPIDTSKIVSVLKKWIPAEKFKGTFHPADAQRQKKSEAAPVIEGLDVDKGILRTGGKLRLYLETLEVFYEEGPGKKIQIRDCLKTRDFALMTIYFHSLKSALANIGGSELSETAKALEMAGNREDIDYIESRIDNFFEELDLLLNKIKAALLSHRGVETKHTEAFDKDAFMTELIGMKAAIINMQAAKINEYEEKLKGLTRGCEFETDVKAISANIVMAEYDKAVSMIDALLI